MFQIQECALHIRIAPFLEKAQRAGSEAAGREVDIGRRERQSALSVQWEVPFSIRQEVTQRTDLVSVHFTVTHLLAEP